jgi:uncharacterized membrane protein YeiH
MSSSSITCHNWVMQNSQNSIEWVVANGNVIFESVGILAFALSGLLESARKKLDLVGMAMVAALAAFGGGTLRDILLDRRPFFWVQNVAWIFVILGLCLLSLFFLRTRHLDLTERAIQWPDAIGLGVFSAGGTQIALGEHMPAIIAVIMGTLTAVFGGVARDIAVNQIPKLFIDHQPYAVVAFTGSWIVVVGDWLTWPAVVSLGLSAIVIIALRMCAVLFGWRLPTWRV